MPNDLLTTELSEPLDGATAAIFDIDTATGTLTIDTLPDGESMLASGTLEYYAKQGAPTPSIQVDNGRATLTLKGKAAGRARFRLPWEACLGGTEWQIHLNPTVSSDITVHTGGGNVRLDLAEMPVTRLQADTGGGNMEVVLPEHAANLAVAARTGGGNIRVEVGRDTRGANTLNATSGAGNVMVGLPGSLPARVNASSGFGKVMLGSRFSETDAHTFETPDFAAAANKVEITLHSGAGNVIVKQE
jgi:hypothetical protein